MSFYTTYRREIWAIALSITLGAVLSTLISLISAQLSRDSQSVIVSQTQSPQPLSAEEKFAMRKTASIQSPISLVELWEVASSKSLCIVAVNINRDQEVQNKLYAAQVAMNCLQPK